MADRTTTRRERGFVWIPPEKIATYKITLESSDGTVYDITNYATNLNITDGVLDTVGSFSFDLYPIERYLDVFSPTDILRFYSNRDATATSLRFRGRINKVSYKDTKITITGQSETATLTNINVTKQYTGTSCSDILKDLIDTYATDFTYSNVVDTTETLTVTWTQKPFFDCITMLMQVSGCNCYIDSSLDFHLFKVGTRINYDEGLAISYNILSISDYAEDSTVIVNRVVVYGAITDGTQIIYTAEDDTSQATYKRVSENVIVDTSITTYDSAKEYADWKLAQLKDAPLLGDITGIFLGTLQPGESIPISSQQSGIIPGLQNIKTYSHTLSENSYETKVSLTKEYRRSTDILKKVIERQNNEQNTSINPENMDYSYNFLFDTDEGTHNKTEITNGVLKLSGIDTSGDWTSPVRAHGSNITEAYLILVGETLTGVTVQVSNDGGTTYTPITNKNKITFSTIESNLKIKVYFTNVDTQIDSLSVLYK